MNLRSKQSKRITFVLLLSAFLYLRTPLATGSGYAQAGELQSDLNELQLQLIHAIWDRDLPILESMLNRGINVNFLYRADPNDAAISPLSEAIAGQQLRMIFLLFEHGADVNFGAEQGLVPLAIAASYDDHDTVVELIRRGAKIDARDAEGFTPLLKAAAHAHNLDVIRLLVAAGADVSTKSKTHGDTAVMLAAANLNIAAVNAFIEWHVDACARNNAGESAMDYANQQILDPNAIAKLNARKQILQLLKRKCKPLARRHR